MGGYGQLPTTCLLATLCTFAWYLDFLTSRVAAAWCFTAAAFEHRLNAYIAAFWMGIHAKCAGLANWKSQDAARARVRAAHTADIQDALHDERHLMYERPAMQCVRDRHPARLNTMQLYMWQRDVVRVAHCIVDRFDVLGSTCFKLVPSLMILVMHQPHEHGNVHQPWRLDGCNPLIQSWCSA